MDRSWIKLCMFAAMTLLAAGSTWADVSKDERNLERESKRLNDTATTSEGEKAVVKELAAQFKMTDSQIKELRDKKLGYGEIAIVLSLAQQASGGVTEANVQKVLAMRQGPPVMGWGAIAERLGSKLGRTVSQIKKVSNDAHREIKKEHAKAVKPAP